VELEQVLGFDLGPQQQEQEQEQVAPSLAPVQVQASALVDAPWHSERCPQS